MKKIDTHKFIIERHHRTNMNDLLVDETILSQANGIIGSRNHFIEGYGNYDYPQTFINGFNNTYPFSYEENYSQFPQEGQTIVNLPDASLILIKTNDGYINLTEMKLIDLKRTLFMNRGVVSREAIYESKSGYQFLLKEEKIVPTNQMLVVSKLTIESLNYSGDLELTSILRMPVIKKKTSDDPRIAHGISHFDLKEVHARDSFGSLSAETNGSHLDITAIMTHDIPLEYCVEHNQILGKKNVLIHPEERFTITKYQIYVEKRCKECDLNLIEHMIHQIESFEAYEKKEIIIKENFWNHAFLELDDEALNQALRYNIYQLGSSGGQDEWRSIAAKGISGDGYEGHYFWDTEAYMHPFFVLTNQTVAKNILVYRYHHLEESKKEAINLGGSRGAKIPWRTINGKEASPYYPAGSAQIHINCDLAHAIITYYYATLDDDFMMSYGAEMLIETALFLLDWGHFKDGKFHLYGVTGPDEYTALVNDNYYTNKMAQAHFKFTVNYIAQHKNDLKSLLNYLNVHHNDLEYMAQAAEHMALYQDPQSGIILQDVDFMNKKEWDIESIPKQKFPILLHHHPLHIYKHQILKQADTLVALVLHDDLDLETYEKTLDYYLKRTTHDSSLSKCMYGIALYKVGNEKLALEYFKSVSELDLYDKKKHTVHGLHAANLGGSYLMLAYGLFGIRMKKTLSIHPPKQKGIQRAQMRLCYQGSLIDLEIKDGFIYIESEKDITIKLMDEHVKLDSQQKVYRRFLN